MVIEFFMAMKPPTITQQEHRFGKGKVYEDQRLKNARLLIRNHLAKHVPEEKMDGPLRLTVKWCFPMAKRRHDGQYKHTKPDTDNLNKLLKDEMERLGFFVNDSRIASEIIEKFWAEIPGIYVKLENLK